MTTISNLPKEILILIFKQLPPTECQWVCKGWYPSAHSLVLKNSCIPFLKIQKFISSIDHNPDPTYLNAVETIHIKDGVSCEYQLYTKEIIRKLFYRFPNLKSVKLGGPSSAFVEFNDKICKTILKRCPKLVTFQVNIKIDRGTFTSEQQIMLDTLYKLRLLLTEIQTSEGGFPWGPDNYGDYISKFPRLTAINGVPGPSSFQKLLPAFKQLSSLKSIYMKCVLDDRRNFAETYLATKSNDEQERLLNNLSSVEDLELEYENNFGMVSLLFTAKYFTGLQKLFITGNFESGNLMPIQEVFLFDTIISLVTSVKTHGCAYFTYFSYDDLIRQLPFITMKLYDNIPSTCNNSNRLVVQMGTEYLDDDKNCIQLMIKFDAKTLLRTITICVPPDQHSLHDIARIIPLADDYDASLTDLDDDNEPLEPIAKYFDNLLVKFGKSYDQKLSTSTYDEILAVLPILKEVTLEIPQMFVPDSSPTTYPLVERLLLRFQTTDYRTHKVLYEFTAKFPNLKQLDLVYFYGKWNKDLHEYQVLLPEHSLERLALDLSGLMYKIEKKGKDFIVVQVSISNNNKRHLFEISRAQVTRIHESDLTAGDDYPCVHVTIKDLQRLDIYMIPTAGMEYADYVDREPSFTLFNNAK